MKDPETESDFAAIKAEEDTLSSVLESINLQMAKAKDKHLIEKIKARELTSEYVSTRRAEDKALLSSDEAVAHAMRDSKRDEIIQLQKQIKKPYFARIRVEEENSNGSLKTFEYRIGYKTNLESRIIDWRTAPIAKLYYEYKEGDEYAEEIQGIERIGQITLRNRVEIHNSQLKRFTTTQATFINSESGWKKQEGFNERSFARSYSQLPPILSLITPEQFRLITESAELPVFIQGIAGSGKTVVALHRISWLLLEQSLEADKCLILVKSPLLKNYIKNSCSLIDGDLEEAATLQFSEWINKLLPPGIAMGEEDLARGVPSSATHEPSSIRRLKNSLGFMLVLNEEIDKAKHSGIVDSNDLTGTIKQVYLNALSNTRRILETDDSKLINRDLVESALNETRKNFEADNFTATDQTIAALIRANLWSNSSVKYSHIFADEVQDFTLAELLLIMQSVKDISSLTMVGDISQSLTGVFPGWDQLLKIWNETRARLAPDRQAITLTPQESLIKLTISHRSTKQIIRLADYIKGDRSGQSEDLNPHTGRVPIWFKCSGEQQAFSAMSDWVLKAQEKYSTAATAVLCKDRSTAKYLSNLLSVKFGAMVKLVDDQTTSLEEGLIVSPISAIKGLEFCNVLIWNPSRKVYSDPILDQNLLYTAATRAEENLAIVTYERPCDFLPNFNSELVRGYDLSLDET